jgi:hypothetical protein
VAGPDGANRLFAVTGIASISMFVNPNQQETQTWTLLVGPALTRPQFHSAVGSGAITGLTVNLQAVPFNYSIRVNSTEADWDEESGQVEMRFEVSLSLGNGTGFVNVSAIAFSATILGQL